MGCFLSSTKKIPPTPNSCNSHTNLQSTTLPFLEEGEGEEEEVKEVLSETPIINNNPIIRSTDEKNDHKNFSLQCQNIHDSHVFKIAKIFNPKDQPSDVYRKISRSMRVRSDSKEIGKELGRSIRVGSDPKELSKSARDRLDPKEKVKCVGAEPRQISPAKYRNTSPARRSDHLPVLGQIRNTSPAKRAEHITGSVQIRNISPGRVGSFRNMGGLSRKDNGESSCRRSRSPVICADQINGGTRNSISRCPSERKSGKSPGRVRSELGDRRRSPLGAGNGSRSNRENREKNYKRPLTSGTNESLENPLVSFECFIFI